MRLPTLLPAATGRSPYAERVAVDDCRYRVDPTRAGWFVLSGPEAEAPQPLDADL